SAVAMRPLSERRHGRRTPDTMTSGQMNLALTSDLPSTANEVVFERMRGSGKRPRVAWIPPFTAMGREIFPAAQQLFESHGFSGLEYCDIDEERNEGQLACLDDYDVIYLPGGDPI